MNVSVNHSTQCCACCDTSINQMLCLTWPLHSTTMCLPQEKNTHLIQPSNVLAMDTSFNKMCPPQHFIQPSDVLATHTSCNQMCLQKDKDIPFNRVLRLPQAVTKQMHADKFHSPICSLQLQPHVRIHDQFASPHVQNAFSSTRNSFAALSVSVPSLLSSPSLTINYRLFPSQFAPPSLTINKATRPRQRLDNHLLRNVLLVRCSSQSQ